MAIQLRAAMIFVKDLDRMVAFYRDTLGLPAVEATRLPDWVEFGTGAATFSLHAIPAAIAADIEIRSPPRSREDTPIKLTLEAVNLDAEIARLEALGVPIIRRPWGSFDFVDPEGNIVALSGARSSTT